MFFLLTRYQEQHCEKHFFVAFLKYTPQSLYDEVSSGRKRTGGEAGGSTVGLHHLCGFRSARLRFCIPYSTFRKSRLVSLTRPTRLPPYCCNLNLAFFPEDCPLYLTRNFTAIAHLELRELQ